MPMWNLSRMQSNGSCKKIVLVYLWGVRSHDLDLALCTAARLCVVQLQKQAHTGHYLGYACAASDSPAPVARCPGDSGHFARSSAVPTVAMGSKHTSIPTAEISYDGEYEGRLRSRRDPQRRRPCYLAGQVAATVETG